jgi:hypothetical protein
MPFELSPKKTRHGEDAAAEIYVNDLVTKHRLAMAAADLAGAQIESRAWPAAIELRDRKYFSEIRAGSRDGQKTLAGHAARFNALSENLGGFKERLAPGCFGRSLQTNGDILLLYGHDPNKLLARTSNRSLAVQEDGAGLVFEATLTDTQLAADAYTEVKSKLIRGMSFGMIVRRDEWSETDCDPTDEEEDCDERRGKIPLRTVLDCSLMEISCVGQPAYFASSVSARALWPAGLPEILPIEVRSRVLLSGGELTPEQEADLRIKMRLAAIQATLL